MNLIIEIDSDWTFGMDWKKHIKGFRLGFIAIHIVFMKHKDFMGIVCEHYHQGKLKEMRQDQKIVNP